MEDEEYESGYPMGQITQAQAKQLLSKRYWNYEKITQWVESLPQVQEIRKGGGDKTPKDEES